MKKNYFWWHEMSAEQVVNHAKVCDIAILPLGAIEQHGPHCPTGTDSYIAVHMCELIAKKTDVILLPCPWYGAHPYHHWYMPGTIPLQNATHNMLIKDIIRGAAHAGYNKFLIFSAHGQMPTITYTVHELGLEGYFVLSLAWYEFVRDAQSEIFETPMWHADETETSIALFLFPEYVDMEKATQEKAEPLIDSKFISGPSGGNLGLGTFQYFEGTFSKPEYKELRSGVIGDATLAKAEKGEKIVSILVERMVEIIEDIKKRYPAGIKPPII